MVRGIFCHDLPIYKDIKGQYGCTTLTDTVFQRYLNIVDELVVATRLYHLDCTLEEAHQERITLSNITFLDIPNLNTAKAFVSELPKARRTIEDELKMCDLVFVRAGTIAGIGARLARKYNKPYLCECAGSAWDGLWYYGFLGKMIAPWAELQARMIIKNASYVTYVTDKWLQEKYPTDGEVASISDVVIQNVSEDVLMRRKIEIESRKPSDKWVIGTAAGLMTKLKGQQFVIEAISLLKDKIDIRYELAGAGDPSYLISVAERFNVTDKLIIKGELNHEEILKWMDSLDTYIQPSMQEGLPRALMEAMSRACPCIGSTAGGIPELLEPSVIFSRGDISELTKTMVSFYESDWVKHSQYNHARAKEFQVDLLDKKRNTFYEKYREYALKENMSHV